MENRLSTVPWPGRAGFEPCAVLEAAAKLAVAAGLRERLLRLCGRGCAGEPLPGAGLAAGPAPPERAGGRWAEPWLGAAALQGEAGAEQQQRRAAAVPGCGGHSRSKRLPLPAGTFVPRCRTPHGAAALLPALLPRCLRLRCAESRSICIPKPPAEGMVQAAQGCAVLGRAESSASSRHQPGDSSALVPTLPCDIAWGGCWVAPAEHRPERGRS